MDVLGERVLIPSVASKRVHVRFKHVLIGREHDMFCRQTLEVWSRRLLPTYNNKCYLARVISSAYNAAINEDPGKKKKVNVYIHIYIKLT